jgi:DNA-binding transcriptional LysR family regulator
MQIDISYPRLKTFYYVAVNKSFKTAASKLCVTEGAVSQAIKDLESKLELRLLERSNRNVSLTTSGLNLLSIIAPIVEKLDHLVEELEQLKGKLKGKIRVASFEAMLLNILPEYLQSFKKNYPECEILLFNTSGRQIRSMVIGGEVDFGIGSVNDLPEGIIGKKIWRFDRYLITPLGHPLSKKKRLTFRDITLYPFIMPDEVGTMVVANKLRSINPNHNVSVEAGGWHVVMKYVELGFGVSLLPGIAIQPKDRSRFYLRSVSNLIGYSQYGILLKKGKYHSPAAKELIRFFSPDFDMHSIETIDASR